MTWWRSWKKLLINSGNYDSIIIRPRPIFQLYHCSNSYVTLQVIRSITWAPNPAWNSRPSTSHVNTSLKVLSAKVFRLSNPSKYDEVSKLVNAEMINVGVASLGLLNASLSWTAFTTLVKVASWMAESVLALLTIGRNLFKFESPRTWKTNFGDDILEMNESKGLNLWLL